MTLYVSARQVQGGHAGCASQYNCCIPFAYQVKAFHTGFGMWQENVRSNLENKKSQDISYPCAC